jgi:hypothetical protein
MSATLSAGVSSLILKLDTPYDRVRNTDARDDLEKVRVWCSTTPNFVPSDSNKVFDALSLSIVIAKITIDGTTFTSLVPGTTYYLKYAFISAIDDVSTTAYTISSELSATPIVASAQTVDISGFTAFSKTGTTFTPATATLTAVLNGITTPQYAWTITGGTLSATNTAAVQVTPAADATSISVTLSVTGVGLTTPITKTIVMAIVNSGTAAQTIDISGYSAFVKNVLGTALTPPNATLTAVTNGILSPQYTWTITGGTLSSSNTVSTTVTPSLSATSVSVTLSVTGTGLTTPITKTIVMVVASSGITGNSVYVATIYKQSATDPNPPTATTSSYNFSTNVLTGPGDGWLTIQPATTTTPTWACDYTFVGAPTATVTGVGNWGPTYIEAVNGANGEYRDVIELYLAADQAPTKPNSVAYTFSGNTAVVTGGTAGWSLTQPATTTIPTYITKSLATTTTPTLPVTLTTWTTPLIVAQNGGKGDTGISIASVTNYYLASASASGVTTATAGWTTTVATTNATLKYLWNYEVIGYSSGSPTSSVPAIIGMFSVDGVGISSVVEYFAVSSSNTVEPTVWVTTPPLTSTINKYLWNYETVTYTNGTTTSTAKRIIGTHGDTGSSIEVQYSEDGSTGWSATPTNLSKWIRINTITNGVTTEGVAKKYIPTLGVEYTVVDGKTTYVHIKYSNDAGTTFTTSNGEDPGEYIGILTNFTATDSNTPGDYTWSRIKGQPGINGTGLQVEYSPNGTTGWVSTPTVASKYIRVNTVAANGTITYGIAQKYIPEVGIDYTVTNGQTSYLHIKYSNNGGVTFTGLNGETTGDYIGTLTDFNAVDSSTPGDYTWAKIKGESGTGTAGASNHRAYKAFTTTSPPTAPPDPTTSGATPATWSAIPVAIAVGQAQYQTDGVTPAGSTTTTWNTPYLSYFKVANLEAITASTGNLNVTGTITVDNDATGSVVIDNGSIRIYNGTALRVKLGRL